MAAVLELKHLSAKRDSKEIVQDISLVIAEDDTHAIMGPNGSGKSTLAHAIMGDPTVQVSSGDVLFFSESVKQLRADERARRGMFLAFQYPVSFPGIDVAGFLRTIYDARFAKTKVTDPRAFRSMLEAHASTLNIPKNFLDRELNTDFSGGEKKKFEMLQLFLLQPKFIMLDEVDSGLDVDALRLIGKSIVAEKPKGSALLIITHYKRILDYVRPDFVHVMNEGRIVETGGFDLAEKIEKKGYAHHQE